MDQRSVYGIAAWCGFATPFVSLGAIAIAISRATRWFSWQHNWLSDLGVHEGSALPFNAGLFISGVLALVLARGVYSYYRHYAPSRIGALVFMAGACALMGIGVFTEDAGRIHYVVSVLFFALVPISYMVMGGCALIRRARNRGAMPFAAGLLAGVMWALPWPGTAGALPEITAALFILAGALFYSALLYKESKR
ncbi:MAG TPA: DUF998 domain-containing protein [Methanomicrobia archaeon]|mgnify:CR=1 FL=1|nr:DUF998 domain-containing protein [Methanomicrobia archaeon]